MITIGNYKIGLIFLPTCWTIGIRWEKGYIAFHFFCFILGIADIREFYKENWR